MRSPSNQERLFSIMALTPVLFLANWFAEVTKASGLQGTKLIDLIGRNALWNLATLTHSVLARIEISRFDFYKLPHFGQLATVS